MQGIASGSLNRVRVQKGQAELETQKKETEEAMAKYNEVKAKLVEVESQLMREMDEINSHVQRAIQAALSQPKLLVKFKTQLSVVHKRKLSCMQW